MAKRIRAIYSNNIQNSKENEKYWVGFSITWTYLVKWAEAAKFDWFNFCTRHETSILKLWIGEGFIGKTEQQDGLETLMDIAFKQEEKKWVNNDVCINKSARSRMLEGVKGFQNFFKLRHRRNHTYKRGVDERTRRK
jgi:hypothetical protein